MTPDLFVVERPDGDDWMPVAGFWDLKDALAYASHQQRIVQHHTTETVLVLPKAEPKEASS